MSQSTASAKDICAEVMLAFDLRKKTRRWVVVVFASLAYLVGPSCTHDSQAEYSKPHIAQISVTGPLQSMQEPWFQQIKHALHNPALRGLILHVNSPGGVVHVAEAGYQMLMRLRNKGIPIVTVVQSQATSAAYLLATTSHAIYTNHTSIIGSIGVKSSVTVFKNTLERVGVQVERMGVGEGLTHIPLQGISAFTKKYLDLSGEDSYNWFKQIVQTRRKMTPKQLEAVVGGRIFTGEEALNLHLTDRIAGVAEAIELIQSVPKNRGNALRVLDYTTHEI